MLKLISSSDSRFVRVTLVPGDVNMNRSGSSELGGNARVFPFPSHIYLNAEARRRSKVGCVDKEGGFDLLRRPSWCSFGLAGMSLPPDLK